MSRPHDNKTAGTLKNKILGEFCHRKTRSVSKVKAVLKQSGDAVPSVQESLEPFVLKVDSQDSLIDSLQDLERLGEQMKGYGPLIQQAKQAIESELRYSSQRSAGEIQHQNQHLLIVIADTKDRLLFEAEDIKSRQRRVEKLMAGNKALKRQVEELENCLSSAPTVNKAKLAHHQLKLSKSSNEKRIEELEVELRKYKEREALLLERLKQAQREDLEESESLTMDLSASELLEPSESNVLA